MPDNEPVYGNAPKIVLIISVVLTCMAIVVIASFKHETPFIVGMAMMIGLSYTYLLGWALGRKE